MTFCKEMSSRVEEPFCKNICFLGIDTKYCSDLYMFLIRLNHLIAVLAISEKAPAHSPDIPMAWLLVVLLVSWLHIGTIQVLCRLGSLQNAKVLLPYRGGVFILGSFLGLPAPCHFVRHSSIFRAAMAAIFGFGGGTNFLLNVLCWPRMAKDLLQVVSVTTFMAILCVFFCTCSFVFIFLVLM